MSQSKTLMLLKRMQDNFANKTRDLLNYDFITVFFPLNVGGKKDGIWDEDGIMLMSRLQQSLF